MALRAGRRRQQGGLAVFAHVTAALAAERRSAGVDPGPAASRLLLLFDGDEHAGTFGGARAFFEGPDRPPSLAGAMIGYPGNDQVVMGSRGFLRVRLGVHGVAAHSGSGRHRGTNAIEKAARLGEALAATPLPSDESGFGLPPRATVTTIAGGEGYSSIPDRCELGVDLRLTPSFAESEARRWVEEVVARCDRAAGPTLPGDHPTEVVPVASQPAFRIPDTTPFVQELRAAAAMVLGRPVPTAVVGPSSVANYLATLGVPATAGFGVTFRGVHAPDECVEVASFRPVFETYLAALRRLLDGAAPPDPARPAAPAHLPGAP
jgi:succinyl-diaminopimelate desuccinylase